MGRQIMKVNTIRGIRAKYIVAFCENGHCILEDGVIIIQNDDIIYVGKKYEGDVDSWVDASNRIVTPGFINTHVHMDGSPLSKSFIEDVVNPQFYMSNLFDVLTQALSYSSEKSVQASATLSLWELIKSGVTTVAIPGTGSPRLVSEIIHAVGLRGYVAPSIASGSWLTEDGKRTVFKPQPGEGFDLLEKAVDFWATCKETYDGRITPLLGPEWIGGCTPELLKEVRRTAEKTGMRVHIHASESIIEFQEVLRKYGMTPIRFLESVDLLGDDLTVGHCIFISGHSRTAYPGDDDLTLLSRYNVSVAHCPWVFARIGYMMESFGKYRQAGVNMSIGTDTCPQNMLQEMRYALILGKISAKDPRTTTAAHIFNAATLGGAKALGRDDLGRICPGAKADLVFFDLDSPQMVPMRDPIRNIVYCADASDIAEVMVGGTMVLTDGKIQGIDVNPACLKLQQCAEKVWETVNERDWKGRSANELSPLSFPSWKE
jgi:5-methylthioadenosine/S-adenosylhomocysteine deaminase